MDVIWLSFYKKKLEDVKKRLIQNYKLNKSRKAELSIRLQLKEEETVAENKIEFYRIKIYKRLKSEGVQEFIE